jgi:hypothetical protein
MTITYDGRNLPAIPSPRNFPEKIPTQSRQFVLPCKKPRHLAGTSHKRGWAIQARALRAQLKALHKVAPFDKGSFTQAAEEFIDFGDQLGPRARYLLRFAFAELLKISRR